MIDFFFSLFDCSLVRLFSFWFADIDPYYLMPCCEGMREKRLTGVALGETGSAGVDQGLIAAALGESRSVVAASTADLGRRRAVCCLFVVCLFVGLFVRE